MSFFNHNPNLHSVFQTSPSAVETTTPIPPSCIYEIDHNVPTSPGETAVGEVFPPPPPLPLSHHVALFHELCDNHLQLPSHFCRPPPPVLHPITQRRRHLHPRLGFPTCPNPLPYPDPYVPPADIPTVDLAHTGFLAVFFSGFWATCLFGSGDWTFSAHFVLASRNWQLSLPDGGSLDLRELLSGLATRVEARQSLLHELQTLPVTDTARRTKKLLKAHRKLLLSLVHVEFALHFIAQRGVRSFVHQGFRRTMTALVRQILPEADSQECFDFLQATLGDPTGAYPNPDLQPDNRWQSIAILPPDWHNLRIHAEQRDHHGFLGDPEDSYSAHILSGDELTTYCQSLATPLFAFYDPVVEERYIPQPPHPFHRRSQPVPPPPVPSPNPPVHTPPPPVAPSRSMSSKRPRASSSSPEPRKKHVFRRSNTPEIKPRIKVTRSEPRPSRRAPSTRNSGRVLPIHIPPRAPAADQPPPPVAPTSWISSQVPGQPPVPVARPLARADGAERVFSGESSCPVGNVVRGLAPGCNLCNRHGTICATWAGPRDPNGALPTKGCRASDACSTAHRTCELWQDFVDAFEGHRSLSRFRFKYWEHLGNGHFAPLEPDIRLRDLDRVARERSLRSFTIDLQPVSSNSQMCPPPSSRDSKPSHKNKKQGSLPPRRYGTRSSNPHTAASQTPTDGSGPIPPIETIDEASESDVDIPLGSASRSKGKGKARAVSEEEEEEDELDSEEGPPDGPDSPYTPAIGPEDFEMDADSPPRPNPAAQASTSNLEDPHQPLPPHCLLPPSSSSKIFADESSFALDTLRYDTLTLLRYYDEHPCENQLAVHGYLEGLLGLVGSIMRGDDMESDVAEE
ncbi:hypothetical protein C8J57DRAFT_1532427 [Mycena rebaudengoi]|nr:hypothetical protein C8J57DRAFT_1532427 [Mycena rebaudengoi]